MNMLLSSDVYLVGINLKMDLSQSGLSMFLRDYQYEALRVLWNSDTGLLSRSVWEQVNANMSSSISRASIINYLNAMLELNILKGSDETGKGGHRTRYSPAMSEEELKVFLSEIVERKLSEMKET